MERFQQSKMSLKVVTPLCIAGGKEITPLDYIYDSKDDKLYLIKKNKWNSFILERKLFDSYLDFVQHSQERARGQKSFNLLEWLNDNQIDIKDVRQAGCLMAETPVYGGKKPNKIAWHIRQCDGDVYIPGSSIKGYIRTAILHKLLMEYPDIKNEYWKRIKKAMVDIKKHHTELSDSIVKFKKKRNDYKSKVKEGLIKYDVDDLENLTSDILSQFNKLIKKKDDIIEIIGNISKELEAILLNKLIFSNDENIKEEDKKTLSDVMKGIQISDALPVETVKTEVLPENDLILNKKKTILIKGEKRTIGPIYEHAPGAYAECISPNSKFNFSVKIDTEITNFIGIKNIDDVIKASKEFTYYVTSKYKNSFENSKEYGNRFSILLSLEAVNADLGSHTGFLRKTLFLSLSSSDKNDKIGFEYLAILLDISFAQVLLKQKKKSIPRRPWIPGHLDYYDGYDEIFEHLELAPRAIKVFPFKKEENEKRKPDPNDMFAGMVYIEKIQ